ncbi:hypothetical protein I7I51_03308 [Histoplasma capsulatum]|uniref:Uncharacterized protein n=1 Tax=Ajellomyces capsulatus TaxID=5037 RepID=A0A8A1M3P3_AJECA|nr:hypothetical protein I7I51_03308 [Histoplasma capsulatum]
MANTQRLLDYLMVAPPGLPMEETNKTSNMTNDQYNWRQINSVGQWSEFTYTHIMQLYGTLLQQVQIENESMLNSPPQFINTELMFAHLAPQLANLHLTPITVDIGDAAQIINNFHSDITFFQASSTLNSSPNRCPEDLKVSWKWGSDWAAVKSQIDHMEYLQVLSQINFYMKQHNTQLNANGNLLVAQAIPWEAEGPGRLTVLLRL